jgi:hypothetical protein
MLSFSPKYSLLPIAGLLLLVAVALVSLFLGRLAPFTGPNTLIFAASCIVAAMSIMSDYLLTREMLYSRFVGRKTQASFLLDSVLGLRKGTDRLFKLAALSAVISILGFIGLAGLALRSELGLNFSALVGMLSCTLMLVSVTFYLTAAKISSYRSLHVYERP